MSKIRWLTHPFTWGAVALITLLCQLTPWVYPGEGATLLAHLTGTWSAPASIVTAHPIVTLLFGALGECLPTSIALPLFNALSAIIGALCVLLLCQIVKHTIAYFIYEPRTKPFIPQATAVAVPVTGLVMLISPDFIRAATHFQWQTIDLFLALGACFMLVRTAHKPTLFKMGLTAFCWGLLSLESTEFLLFTPFFALMLALSYYTEQEEIHLKVMVRALLVPMAIGAILTFLLIYVQTLALRPETTFRACLAIFANSHLATITQYFTQGPWILVTLTGLLPAAITLFCLRSVGQNLRSRAFLFTVVTTFVFISLAILPQSLATTRLLSTWGETNAVLFPVLTAFAFAGLLAIAVFFQFVKVPPEATEESPRMRGYCAKLAKLLYIVTPIILITSIATITCPSRSEERHFATLPRNYADAILECATEGETWLLSDGFADAYLALRSAQRQLPVTIFSLTQDNDPAALERLQQALNASSYFATKPELKASLERALDIGLIPFIQDWVRSDASSEQHFVTLSLPDLWYTSDRLPLPQQLWYRGASDRNAQHARLSIPDVTKWDLRCNDSEPSKKATPTVTTFFERVKRQEGFVLNNIAFYLADAGKLEEAFALFERVYALDSSNVSALFNLFELINGGLYPEKKAWCEREVNELLRKMRGQRYRLWALARTYGYIRSPQLMSMLAGSWAMSGQTGAALSGLDLALAMLDDGKQAPINQAIAALCMADPSRRDEAINRYQTMLANAKDRHQSLAYTKELVRMHILNNDLPAAKATLEQYDPTGESNDLAYERALWFSSAGQPDRARATLGTLLENIPRHLEALSLLATLQLQAGELTALENQTLPKLKTVANTDDNYFVQIITAQIAERKQQLDKARAAYLRALALKPEVHALRTTVLSLDIRLNDKIAAARHAKQFLYQDRSLPLANYIMGALALGEGDTKRALSYLSIATAATVAPPIPEAFNDLAETHRQLGDWAASLAAAQHACKLSPNLAIARETAAAALLELGRYQEAHAYLKEAFALEARLRPNEAPDPRLYITRARVYVKEGLTDLARVDLHEARKQYDSLDATAKAEFDALATTILTH